MTQLSIENLSELLSNKYKNADKTKKDILAALERFKGLVPQLDTYVFTNGSSLDLVCLSGTIPVNYKGAQYNIPVCIWVLDNNAPLCYVQPTKDMRIKVSRYVDQSGKIYLPYLHEWQTGSSDLVSLIQVMTTVFAETPPVFTVPTGMVYTPYPPPYPSLNKPPVPGAQNVPYPRPYPPLDKPQSPCTPSTSFVPQGYPNSSTEGSSSSGTATPYSFARFHPPNIQNQSSETKKKTRSIDPDGIYPMTPGKIGQCLIINNVDFQHEDYHQRDGSDIDACRLEDLFTAFGFHVTVKRNLTAKKMRSSIWNVARVEENKDCSAFILVVLTHGDEGLLCGTDYQPGQDLTDEKSATCFTAVTYKEIVRLLDNNNSRYLRNKPKICFIQACNGIKRSEIAEEGNTGQSGKKYVTTRLPEASDILLSFAAQEGYSTFKKPDTGGIYAYHLANVLEDHAADCDLLEMLGMVERRIRSEIIKVYDKEKRKKVEVCLSTSVKQLGWSKKFYFHTEGNLTRNDVDG